MKNKTFIIVNLVLFTFILENLNAQVSYTGCDNSGTYASALGYNSVATGNQSFAVGNSVSATNSYSNAFGYYSTASGYNSFAFGYRSEAIGSRSYAFGAYSVANSSYSFALGRYCTANASNSYALGYNTLANSNYGLAIGKYNKGLTNSLFEIGYGSSSSARSNVFTVLNTGNIGIGTTSPTEKLHVTGNILLKGDNGFNSAGEEAILYLGDTYNYIKSINGQGVAIGAYCWNEEVDINAIYINQCGKVGIGTDAPGSFKLAVDGYIGARGVKVTSIDPFPDYVFEPDYNLLSIKELDNYITENKHLPNIPTATEVEQEEGVDLGELQIKLLEKIEEQTLYIISLQEQIDELNTKVKILTDN